MYYSNSARNSLVYREMYTELIESSSPVEDHSKSRSGNTSSSGRISVGGQGQRDPRPPSFNLFRMERDRDREKEPDLASSLNSHKISGSGGTGSHKDCSNASSSNKDSYGHFQSFPTSSCSSQNMISASPINHSSSGGQTGTGTSSSNNRSSGSGQSAGPSMGQNVSGSYRLQSLAA